MNSSCTCKHENKYKTIFTITLRLEFPITKDKINGEKNKTYSINSKISLIFRSTAKLQKMGIIVAGFKQQQLLRWSCKHQGRREGREEVDNPIRPNTAHLGMKGRQQGGEDPSQSAITAARAAAGVWLQLLNTQNGSAALNLNIACK